MSRILELASTSKNFLPGEHSVIDYRNKLIEYLNREKEFSLQDIDEHNQMTDTQKVDAGLLICNAVLVSRVKEICVFDALENDTKLRTGDKVRLRLMDGECSKIAASVIENQVYSISLCVQQEVQLEIGKPYRIEVYESVNLDGMIAALEKVADGRPGCYFLEYLCGQRVPSLSLKYGKLPVEAAKFIPETLNEVQKAACLVAFNRPQVACLQGIPGSGKTHVLAAIAKAFSIYGKEVLVLALTHQAVNNALNKIKSIAPELPVVKIGDQYKAEGLDCLIEVYEKYGDFLQEHRAVQRHKGKGPEPGFVVGMTLASSVINLGLMNQGFSPSIALIDEAGQLPLAEAAVVGTYPTGSFIFIGDDVQMPPIFHQKLSGDTLSTSIFSVLASQYPQNRIVLDTTYRMNDEITALVNKCFYGPRGINLTSAECTAKKRLPANYTAQIGGLSSVVGICCGEEIGNTDSSMSEATVCTEMLRRLINAGLDKGDVAVVTPFRRQVRLLREKALDIFGDVEALPLIDTVERLQGQDVEIVILSFASSAPDYCFKMREFLMEPHRLNVMISRAKTKVVVVASPIVFKFLEELGINPEMLSYAMPKEGDSIGVAT